MDEHSSIFTSNPRKVLLVACLVGLAAVALLMAAPNAHAAVTSTSITSASGPLTRITIGQDLGCEANYLGDASDEFFPPKTDGELMNNVGDCGTMLMVDPPTTGTFFGPDFSISGHGGTAAGKVDQPVPHTNYVYTSQSAVSGTGGGSTPYKITTIVEAGKAHIVQDDFYFLGDQFWSTSTTITNTDSGTHNYRLWRAADCYLGDDDEGYGWADPPGNYAKVACTVNPYNQPNARYEMFTPLTPGSHYMEDQYDTVWQTIGARAAFPDTIHAYGKPPCTQPPAPPPNPPCPKEDNGMGLSWDFQLNGGAQFTIAATTKFQPDAPPNMPPTVGIQVTMGTPTCKDSHIQFTAIASDPDGSISSVVWDFGDGKTAEASSASHTYADEGDYTVIVTVTDNGKATASATRQVHAPPDTNCCPELSPVPDRSVMEGLSFRFFPYTTDWEGDSMTYTMQTELPHGATLDASTGYFAWRTLGGDAGDYQMTLHVTDNRDHSSEPAPCQDTQNFILKVTPKPPSTPITDSDRDGIDDSADNCPGVPNLDQADRDRDNIGDACQGEAAATTTYTPTEVGPKTPTDRDGDGVPDTQDLCPGIANGDQTDFDHDRIGDVCDADLDGDGIMQTGGLSGSFHDNCPLVPNPDQTDTGNLGIGDKCRGSAGQQAGAGIGATDGQPAADGAASVGAPASKSPILMFGIIVAVAAVILTVGVVMWGVRRRE
ncbi:MAG: PKD domain-containing protein [bacterium]